MMRTILVMTMLVACATSPAPRPVAAAVHTAELAARRAQALQWLHEYAAAGVFPTDERGMPLSVFRDARGVRCPMAELIHRSGHDELVDEVARTNNALRLADVHDGPLYAWMLSSGLTRDEINMVQGAMRVDNQIWGDAQLSRIVAQADARGQVRGHLATAEVALRDNTSHSLDVAATARASQPRTRVAARTTPASPQSSGTKR